MIATQNNIMNLLVAKNIARTGSTATDPAASTYIVDGEVVVTDESNTILDSTTVLTKTRVKLVQSQGASLPTVESPMIELAGVKTYTGKAYTAPVAQVDYIGYNAATAAGDIDVISDNGYEILIHDINSAAYGSVGVGKFGFYVSDSSATKAEINDGLAISLSNNVARVVRVPFTVERVSSATFVVTTIGVTGAVSVFTNGSTVVTGLLATTEVPVGTYIRVGTTAASTLTLGIYKVVAATATTITLDQPFQGTSGTYINSAFAASILTSTPALNNAAINASSLGIKLTGKATVFTTPQSTEFYVNRWITTVRNGGITPVVAQVGATEGSGSYAQMASLEYFLVGNEGSIARNNVPYQSPRASIVLNINYAIIALEWDTVGKGRIFNQEAASKQLLIAFQEAGSRQQLTGQVTSIQNVLNAWLPATFPDLSLS